MTFREYYKRIGHDLEVMELLLDDKHLAKEVTIENCIDSFNILYNVYQGTLAELRDRDWHTGTPDTDGDYLVAFRMNDGSVEYGWCVWDSGGWDIVCDYDPNDGTCTLEKWMKIKDED